MFLSVLFTRSFLGFCLLGLSPLPFPCLLLFKAGRRRIPVTNGFYQVGGSVFHAVSIWNRFNSFAKGFSNP